MITKILDAGSADMRARFVFYLHKQKHAEVCDFLYSLPPGTVSNFVREALQQYIKQGGLPSASADHKHEPSRLPATTQIPISARTSSVEDQPLPQPELSIVTVTKQPEPQADRPKNSSTMKAQPGRKKQ